METKSQKTHPIPAGISEYIKKTFREDYLTDIKLVKDKKGIGYYYVDVTHEDSVYHLKFNESGAFLQEEIESVKYPDDEVELGNAD